MLHLFRRKRRAALSALDCDTLSRLLAGVRYLADCMQKVLDEANAAQE